MSHDLTCIRLEDLTIRRPAAVSSRHTVTWRIISGQHAPHLRIYIVFVVSICRPSHERTRVSDTFVEEEYLEKDSTAVQYGERRAPRYHA